MPRPVSATERQTRGSVDAHPQLLFGEALVKAGVGRLDGERSAVGHGIAGVRGKVHDHLFHLARVRHDLLPVPAYDLDLDILRQDPPQDLLKVLERRSEMDRHGLDHLLAAEGEEALDQARGAF